ncbi:hypothetical protein [Actinokineospora inagensis]|uniref:hypothetical protein n=1 Tax=Actinokineospora inagensis TaxID=103730 RepID=UPI000413AD3B|nr:hypothetical protein [Actinokineospora inagensis]
MKTSGGKPGPVRAAQIQRLVALIKAEEDAAVLHMEAGAPEQTWRRATTMLTAAKRNSSSAEIDAAYVQYRDRA